MPTYRVVWEIDVDADSHEEAAQKTREIQEDQDVNAISHVYHVTEMPGGSDEPSNERSVMVDLDAHPMPADTQDCDHCGGEDACDGCGSHVGCQRCVGCRACCRDCGVACNKRKDSEGYHAQR